MTQIKTTTTTTKRCIRESACSPQYIDRFAFQYLFQKYKFFCLFLLGQSDGVSDTETPLKEPLSIRPFIFVAELKVSRNRQ